MSSSQISAGNRLAAARSLSLSLYKNLLRGVRAKFPSHASADARTRATFQLAGKPTLLAHAPSSAFVDSSPIVSSDSNGSKPSSLAVDLDWEGLVRTSFEHNASEAIPEVRVLIHLCFCKSSFHGKIHSVVGLCAHDSCDGFEPFFQKIAELQTTAIQALRELEDIDNFWVSVFILIFFMNYFTFT
jgi:hypothetical protein